MKPKASASPPQGTRTRSARKQGTPGAAGRLSARETQYLVMLALEAMHYQIASGNIPPDTHFDTWRRAEVERETGLAGLSKINRSHVRSVAARFFELAGRDDEALEKRLHTGPKHDRPDAAADTWETSETYVHQIRQALADHAKVPAEQLAAGKTHIRAGWIIAAARQRSHKPTLTLDDFAARLDPQTLAGLLSHLHNHIAVREGRSDPSRRQARVYPPKSDPGVMWEDDPF